MENYRKAFNFDLSIQQLKEHYPSNSENGYKKAWSDIKKFMESHGFQHSQYSGYESIYPLTKYETLEIINELNSSFPWFLQCAQVAAMTNIGNHYDVLTYLKETDSPVSSNPKPSQDQKISLSQKVVAAREASQVLMDESSHTIKEQTTER